MVIKQYDVSLERLRHEHIEEVRQWRNSDKVKSRMEFREYITPEMQEEWFKKINDINTYIYYLMKVNEKHIGVFHCKDFLTDNTEAGMFIWDDNYLNSPVPVIASIMLTDFNFYIMRNTRVNCRILKSNKQAIAYNMSIGFRICEGQNAKENQLYMLNRNDYELNAPAVRNNLRKMYPGFDNTITVHLDADDERKLYGDAMEKYISSPGDANIPIRFVF